jgi:glycosyltransferase involved in cell wall biosynthesis
VPDARLMIAGDGPSREAVAIRADAIGGVELRGVVPNDWMPALFGSSSVVVSPSRTHRAWAEQVSQVNLQAMACGRPVVSTWTGSIPEFLPPGLTGLLVDEGDIDGLASTILRLLTDRTLSERIGRDGHEYARRHYDAKANVQAAERLVLEVLDQR